MEDFDPEQKGHSGIDQKIEESALPLVSKGKHTRARSGKENSTSESKPASRSQQTRNKPTLTVSSCGKVNADDHSHSLKPRSRRTRRSSLPSVGTDGEFRVYCSGCIS